LRLPQRRSPHEWKKVSFARPPASAPGAVDNWVKTREIDRKATKRLTIDVSEDLHRRLKSECAMGGKKMKDVVTQLIEDALARSHAGNRKPAFAATRKSTNEHLWIYLQRFETRI
jgi:hypothetical protein